MSNCRTFRFYNRVGVVFQLIKQILWSIILMHTSRYWFFAKAMNFLIITTLLSLVAASETSTTPLFVNCTAPLRKYYSVDKADACGETCLKGGKAFVLKPFERNLTLATVNDACAVLGYDKYLSTVTHGIWPIKTSLDLYGRS